jgi:hypothetical protein
VNGDAVVPGLRRCGWKHVRAVVEDLGHLDAAGDQLVVGAPLLGGDLSAHLVFGVATSAVFAALAREKP